MRKPLIILLLSFSLPVLSQAQAKQPICQNMIADGKKAEENGDLQIAMQAYLNALNCDSKLADVLGPRINQLFAKIEQQKNEAEFNKRLAQQKQREAENYARTVLANDLVSKVQAVNDRTASFRLLEMAASIQPDNPRVMQGLFDNCIQSFSP